MFWYTKDELVELYDNEFGKNYYGKDYMKCPVMILRKPGIMLPYEISNAGIQSGEIMTAYINREEIYFKDLLGAKLDTTLGKEIINCLAFIDKNPNQTFYTLLVYPNTLSVEANDLMDMYGEVEKIVLSAEDIELGDMTVNAFLVKATIATKRKIFRSFSDLSKLVEGADSRMVTILPNIDPAEYRFYYNDSI